MEDLESYLTPERVYAAWDILADFVHMAAERIDTVVENGPKVREFMATKGEFTAFMQNELGKRTA